MRKLSEEAGEKSLRILKENYILTLAIYEVGNVLWREMKLLEKLAADEAEEIMKAIIALTKFMQIIGSEDPAEILKTSNRIEATLYDTAYVVVALRRNLILVTDDKKLAAKIEKYQDAILKEHKRKLHVVRSTDL